MEMDRRTFLRTAAAGVCAGLLHRIAPGFAEGAADAERGPALPVRTLGRTGRSVTILGLGCAYIAHNADEARSRATVEAALEGGVRYFDTSPDYLLSEERLGPVLAPVRDSVFLVTKINGVDFAAAEAEFARSLSRLKTDHVDLLLQHGVGLGESVKKTAAMMGPGGSLEFLRTAKKKGLARFIGMSVHPGAETGAAVLDASDEWDVVMPFVNFVSRTRWNEEERIVGKARRRNIGVVGMKTLGGQGQLAGDYDAAFRYVLSVPGVACALVGARTPDEVRRAVRAAREFRPLTPAEMEETIRRGAAMLKTDPGKVALLERHAVRDLASTLPA